MANEFDPKSELLIQKLQSYYSFLTPTDLIGKYATQSTKAGTTPDQIVAGVVMNTIFNTSFKGFYSLRDIAAVFEKQLGSASDELKKEFKRLVFVKADGLQLSSDKQKTPTLAELMGVPSSDTDINNNGFNIGYILTQSPRISLGVKDAHSVSAFLNTIPTVEFARAVPYLSVNFKTGRETLTGKGQFLNAPTVLKFINGAAQVKNDSPDFIISTATSNSDTKKSGFDHMGMEIFTSPIAMTPLSINADPILRSTRISDPNRPIMSIENFNVEVISPIGVFAYKTAGLNIILHDKSRLSEISDLVRPEGFGGATPGSGIEITYGWSHPDDVTSGNVYGTLLNRNRVTEVFAIINSKFSFTPTGEVKITLSLAAKGGYDMHRHKILDGTGLDSEVQELQKLIEKIKNLREQLGLVSSDVMKEIRVYQVLDSAEAAERPDLKEFKKKLDGAISTIKKMSQSNKGGKTQGAQKACDDLIGILNELYTKKDDSGKGDGGLIGKIDRTINGAINAKFIQLQTTRDPFLIPKENRDTLVQDGKYPWDAELAKWESDALTPDGKKRKFVCSLGSLLMSFVGLPLVENKDTEEVQFVFHVFNDFAGLAGSQSIAAFPIEIEYFKDIFQKLARVRRDPNYTLEEFTRIVSEHLINNPRSLGYGMRSLYQVSNDKENADALPKIELAKNSNEEKVASQMSRIMAKTGGTFKFPILEAFVETLPRRVLKEDKEDGKSQLPENDSSYNITRIHFYDKLSTPYEPIFDLLAAARGEQLNQNIDEQLPEEYKTDKLQTQSVLTAFASYVAEVRKAKTADEKKNVPIPKELSDSGEASFKVGGNIIIPGAADLLRDFIRETIPTITYGSNLSAVKTADVTTMQDAQQQAIFLKRAGKGNPTQPNGSDVGGLPIVILPTVVGMTTLGCPLLSLMQQFFVDFGTNTTADNVYFVTGLSHEIAQGRFESKIKFTPGEAYGKFKPIQEALKQVAELLKIDSGGK